MGRLLTRARRDGHHGRLVGLDPGAGMLAVARDEPDVEWVSGVLAPAAYEWIVIVSKPADQR